MFLFGDTFDHYAAGAWAQKWDGFFNGNGFLAGPSTLYGRNGTLGMVAFMNVPGNQGYVWKTFRATKTTLIMGAAIRGAGSGASGMSLFSLADAGVAQCELRLLADGSLTVCRNGTVLGTSSPGVVEPDTGSHRPVHWKVTVGNSASTEVRVDGVTVLSLAGVDTQNTANAYATQLFVGTWHAVAGLAHYDDFFLFDDTGSVNNDFPTGDVRGQYLPVNAAGDSAQYTRSGGSANYEMVDETNSDGDTTYNESITPGHVDLLNVGPLASAGTILGVGVVGTDRKTNSGPRTTRHKIRFGSGPTTVDGPAYSPGTSYFGKQTIFENAITAAEIDGLQVGYEIVT